MLRLTNNRVEENGPTPMQPSSVRVGAVGGAVVVDAFGIGAMRLLDFGIGLVFAVAFLAGQLLLLHLVHLGLERVHALLLLLAHELLLFGAERERLELVLLDGLLRLVLVYLDRLQLANQRLSHNFFKIFFLQKANKR